MARSVYSVKQVNAYIKNMFAQDYLLNRIYVRGEVSNCKYHTSGHIYFSLKDESGTIACAMFAGQRGGLSFRMGEGQQVVVFGSIGVYERNGDYRLYAKEIILAGAGELYERFEALKRELSEMGMFAPEYKKEIPAYAGRVGIVTAPTGAAIRDIMNVAKRRNPYVQLVLYPALVQGEGAKESIAKGIKALDESGVDVIIAGRGGGSMEDLWAFNEEEVARAIFNCRTPVISAVGHETDTTIADFVADLRAPTPSAAAELAVYEYAQAAGMLEEYKLRMRRLLSQKVDIERLRLQEYRTKLSYLHPQNVLRDYRQRAADYDDRMRRRMENALQETRHRFSLYLEKMKGLSPLAKLEQGYSYVRTGDGHAMKSIRQAEKGEEVLIYVTDGIVTAVVEKAEEGLGL